MRCGLLFGAPCLARWRRAPPHSPVAASRNVSLLTLSPLSCTCQQRRVRAANCHHCPQLALLLPEFCVEVRPIVWERHLPAAAAVAAAAAAAAAVAAAAVAAAQSLQALLPPRPPPLPAALPACPRLPQAYMLVVGLAEHLARTEHAVAPAAKGLSVEPAWGSMLLAGSNGTRSCGARAGSHRPSVQPCQAGAPHRPRQRDHPLLALPPPVFSPDYLLP